MSSNSGLYEDSDWESISNELSPTDGYFNRRPSHPQDVLIPNPSQNPTETDKAREAREEGAASRGSEASAAQRNQSHYEAPLPSFGRRLDPAFEEDSTTEQTRLISAAPPAYSAATAGSSYQPPSSHNTTREHDRVDGYNTMGRQGAFLPNGAPEDLGGPPPDDDSHGDDGWKQQSRRCIRGCFASLGKFFLVLIALIIGIGFIANAIFGIHSHHGSKNNPVKAPNSGNPGSPGNGRQSCPAGNLQGGASFGFKNISEFAFVELVHDADYVSQRVYSAVHTSGELHVRSASADTDSFIGVEISLLYSDAELMRMTTWSQGGYNLALNTPRHIATDSTSSREPCIYITTTIWVAPGLSLDKWSIDSQSMSITFHEGLFFSVQNGLSIDATVGSLIMPPRGSTETNMYYRELNVALPVGSATGSYSLNDKLSITTSSGLIDIDIDLKEASQHRAAPAELYLQSTSGTIRANTPALVASYVSIPNRDYRMSVFSRSGGLYLHLVHGTTTRLHTNSGSIHAILSPSGALEARSYIESHCDSGSTDISVLPSRAHPGIPMGKLFGTHESASGSLRIQYPEEWQGQVDGKTLSGSFSLTWAGMKLIRNSKEGWVWRVIKAIKGNGEGTLTFKSVSGNVVLIGGEESEKKGPNSGGTGDRENGDKAPVTDEPGLGVPPPRWPGYDDEWGVKGMKLS
ncbi:hypothetical protein MMC24_002591 [Lignoscripta atroalba]|nr:hypothetical protein [Lignoscripta atroalba]